MRRQELKEQLQPLNEEFDATKPELIDKDFEVEDRHLKTHQFQFSLLITNSFN
jgi:hypothetical protein